MPDAVAGRSARRRRGTSPVAAPRPSIGDTVQMQTSDVRIEGPIVSVAPFPKHPAPGFVRNVYEHRWEIGRPRSAVWSWLCDPATFVDGQIPPFRVEFLTNSDGESGFAEGVYNSHVGPFMSFSGVLAIIEPERYRDLQYFYGSYAVSHALFRPTRLQFWVEDGPVENTTVMQLRLDTDVRRRAEQLWVRGMNLFWRRFGRWCERGIPDSWLR